MPLSESTNYFLPISYRSFGALNKMQEISDIVVPYRFYLEIDQSNNWFFCFYPHKLLPRVNQCPNVFGDRSLFHDSLKDILCILAWNLLHQKELISWLTSATWCNEYIIYSVVHLKKEIIIMMNVHCKRITPNKRRSRLCTTILKVELRQF